jgi:hypothetical protein
MAMMNGVNAGIDFTRSQAYCVPNANEGYVRVNLKGREPRGLVTQGAAYQDLLAELETQINELTVPASAKPAVHRTFRIDDVFPGPARPNLPDLVVTWNVEPESSPISNPALRIGAPPSRLRNFAVLHRQPSPHRVPRRARAGVRSGAGAGDAVEDCTLVRSGVASPKLRSACSRSRPNRAGPTRRRATPALPGPHPDRADPRVRRAMCGIAGPTLRSICTAEASPTNRWSPECATSSSIAAPTTAGVTSLGPACLGARRLSIIDLSPAGHMPMSDASGRWWITYKRRGLQLPRDPA